MKKIQTRCLIIMHNPLSDKTGTGKTVKAMFSAFDKSNLAQIYITESPVDYSCCENYYLISDTIVLHQKLNNIPKQLSKKINNTENNTDSIKINSSSNSVKQFLSRYVTRSKVGTVIRSYMWSGNSWLTNDLEKWISDFDPDMLFVVPGYVLGVMDMAMHISNKYRIPIATYVTDDYFSSKSKFLKGEIWSFYNRILRKKYKELSSKASLHFVIGEKMAVLYNEEYGCEHKPIMNCVDISIGEAETNNHTCSQKKSIQLTYAGNCGLGRDAVLLKLADSLSRIKRKGIDATLVIYTPSKISNSQKMKFEQKPNCLYKGSVNSNELKDICMKSDFLVHVESFGKRYREIIETAISTKIPEYLSYKVPIILVGPIYAGVIDYVDKNKVGFCITNEDSIDDALMKVFNNQSEINNRVKQGWLLVNQNHNKLIVSQRLFEDISSLVKGDVLS